MIVSVFVKNHESELFHCLWRCLLVSRARRATHQRPPSVVHASSMCVVVQPWLSAVIEQCSLTTCPHLVPCPGRRERRFYLPWEMMVRRLHCNPLLTCRWITTIRSLHSLLLSILREGSVSPIALHFMGEVFTDSM